MIRRIARSDAVFALTIIVPTLAGIGLYVAVLTAVLRAIVPAARP